RRKPELGVQPEGAFGKLVALEPIQLAGPAAEVLGTGLALQRLRDLARGIPRRTIVFGFRHHGDDVARFAVLFPTRHDETDGALVCLLLQLGERAGLAPAETGAEIPQPPEQVVGAHLGDRALDQRFNRLALGKLLDRARRPPYARKIYVGQEAI